MRENKDVRLLVVDDEAPLRKAIVFEFRRRGFQVTDASNGTEAFEIVRRQPIDIILTDVRMPGGDGIELLRNVKEMDPHLPVVMFITGFADIGTEDAYDQGVDAVFSKPFDRKKLIETVVRAAQSMEDQWSAGRERIETDFKVDLVIPELNFTSSARVVNIGRGGMFLSLSGELPPVDSKITFRFQIDRGPLSCIEGRGTVRWVRNEPNADHPTGCGIEFEFISDDSRAGVIELIKQMKTKAFIPKH